MRRRDFIKVIAGSAAVWPLATHAQQRAMPVVGGISADAPDLLRAFRQGLKETGYVEHENIAIEYRAAQNQIGRLSEFAADLVRRKVDVIVAAIRPQRLRSRRRPQQSRSFSSPRETQ